jgi:hypothetical protein
MGRYTGILGLLTMLGLAYVFSTNRARHPCENRGVGPEPADRVRDICAAH